MDLKVPFYAKKIKEIGNLEMLSFYQINAVNAHKKRANRS